ncbi:hypothetical protein GCM10010266_65640 [Streptomyces griseomycini]|nr:hypothetical protein GCM10010266_65640 [Streptomyces griseomycini]
MQTTRAEVLLDGAIEIPVVGTDRRPTGGHWFFYYDAAWVTSASSLDVAPLVSVAATIRTGTPAAQDVSGVPPTIGNRDMISA